MTTDPKYFSKIQINFPDICYQKKEVGPCRASQPQFFYNPEIQDCDFFLYGGCRGNDNRFSDIGKCRKVCLDLDTGGEQDNEESVISEENEDETPEKEDQAESEDSDGSDDKDSK